MIVTVEELKAHLNITFDDDDSLIADKIAAAEEWIAAYLGANLDEPPAPVKEAVKQLAAHLYENREPVLVGVNAHALPFGVLDLIAPYRDWVF